MNDSIRSDQKMSLLLLPQYHKFKIENPLRAMRHSLQKIATPLFRIGFPNTQHAQLPALFSVIFLVSKCVYLQRKIYDKPDLSPRLSEKKIIFYCYPWFKSIPNFTEVTFGLCCGRNKKKYVQLWSSKNGKNRRVSCCWIFHNLYSLKFERPENVDFHHHLNFSKRDFSFCRWYFAFLFFEVM